MSPMPEGIPNWLRWLLEKIKAILPGYKPPIDDPSSPQDPPEKKP